MKGINDKYYIKVEVLTPLCVGAGAEKDLVKGVDYVVHNGELYRLNMNLLMSDGVDISRLCSAFESHDDSAVVNLIGVKKLESVSDYVLKMPIQTENDIKAFYSNGICGTVIIPGSSMKGSIRSILFDVLRTEDEKDTNIIFGSMKDGSDFMRFIKISDVAFKDKILVNTKLFNLIGSGSDWYGGWKHSISKSSEKFRPNGFNTVYEVVEPGQYAVGSIMLSKELFNQFSKFYKGNQSKQTKKDQLLNPKFLFSQINAHTKEYLRKEKEFFQKYPAEQSDKIESCIDGLFEQISTDSLSCVFKMAAGVGFHSITGDWQYDDYDETGYWESGRNTGKKKYKSRRIAQYRDSLCLMGFVKISIIDSNEAVKMMNEYQTDFDNKKNEVVVKHNNIIEQRNRIATSNRNKAILKSVKNDVQRLMDENKFIEAKQLLVDSKLDVTSNEEIKNLYDIIERKIQESHKIEGTEKLKSQAFKLFEEHKYSEAKSAFEQAAKYGVESFYDEIIKCEERLKAERGDIKDFIVATSIPALAGRLKKWMKSNEISISDIDVIADELKKQIAPLNSSKQKAWLDFSKWEILNFIGESLVKELYDKIKDI